MNKRDKSGANLMTEGPVWQKIIFFALPVFWGNLFQQLYNIVDSLVVGNFVGKDALAAVGSSGSLIFMLVGFVGGIYVGAGVVIARYFGAKDTKNMQEAIHTTVAFAVIAGVLLTIVGIVFTPGILRLIKTPESILPNSILYFRIYFSGVLAMTLYNTANGIFQAVGDSKHPLYYLITSSIINVVLDLLFVAVFHWGIAGAAIATVLAQATSAFLGFFRLMRIKEDYRVQFKKIRINKVMLKQVLNMGIPTGLQNSIIAIANVFVQANINSFGASAVAGCGAYSKIEGFGFLPINSFVMAITTFIGQNLGAKKYDRAKKGARFGIVLCVACSELVGLMIYFFAPYFIAAFNNDPEVVAFGTLQAHTVTLFYFLLAFTHSIAGVMRGAGRSKIPMFVMMVCWCIIRITFISIILRFFPQIQSVFWAYPFTWSLSSVVFACFYLFSDWVHAYEKREKTVRNGERI